MACIAAPTNPCHGVCAFLDDEDDVMDDVAPPEASKLKAARFSDDDVMSECELATPKGEEKRECAGDVSDNDVLSDCGRDRGAFDEEDVLEDIPPVPAPVPERQCSVESLPANASDVDENDVLEDTLLLPPVGAKRQSSVNIVFMDESFEFVMPSYSEEDYDRILFGKPAPKKRAVASRPRAKPTETSKPPPSPSRTSSPQPRAQPQQPKSRTSAPQGHASRPAELCGPTLAPTGVARAWWQAARVAFAETKDHRKPEVICHRNEYDLAKVEREVRKAWATLAKCGSLCVMPKSKVKKIVTEAAESCLQFVFRCATHDRAEVATGICGARVTFPTGGSHRGRDPGFNPYCSNKATSARSLCSRCSQLFFRVESTAAFVFMTIFTLTSATDDVDAHLVSLARLIHWFACTSTYLNRSFFYSDIQTWTVAIINNIVGERVSLAESVAAKLLSSSEPRKLKRASA